MDKVFIDLCKADFQASKILLKKKIYHLSLYHMSQSVEKAIKYILIMSYPEDKKYLKKIGHDYLKAFISLTQYYEELSKGYTDPLEKGLLSDLFDQCKKADLETLTSFCFKTITSLSNDMKKCEDDFNFRSDIISSFRESATEMLMKKFSINENVAKQYLKTNPDIQNLNFTLFGIPTMLILMNFAMIFSVYSPDEYRYPDNSNLKNPISIYNTNHHYVRVLFVIHKLFELSVLNRISHIDWSLSKNFKN